MVKFSKQIEIQTPAEIVWNVMQDVETWNEWTPTITSIKRINGEDFNVGTHLLIEQPKLPTARWLIFEVENKKSFSIKKGNGFLTVVTRHDIINKGSFCSVNLSIEFSGFFAKWVAKKYRPMMEEYLATEASGLKKICERIPKVEPGQT